MKAFFLKYSSLLMAAVLLIGQLSINVACSGECYQPKVPEKLLKRK